MRKIIVASVLALFAAMSASAATPGRAFLPDLLPQNTIVCLSPPDAGTLEREYSGSLFARLGNIPDMAPFLRSFDDSRRALANDIAHTANIQPQLAAELVNGRLGFALLNLGPGRDGKMAAEFVVSLSLAFQPDRDTIYAAVMALLNRPEIVRQVLESQGLDPTTPLKTLAQEEVIAGYPPILRIGPAVRVASVGNMIILYHGPNSEGIIKIFDAMSNPAASLTRSAPFQAVYRGADAKSGMSFTYLNVPRLLALCDLMNFRIAGQVAEAAGLGAATAIGFAGGYQRDGVRHNIFVNVPGGMRDGLFAAIPPMPESPFGMEAFANVTPASAEAFMSARLGTETLLAELPAFIAAISPASRPGGVAGMAASESILGVPVSDILRAIGSDIVIRPHDDTQVALFNNVDIPAFESVIARMEQNAGARFNSITVGGYAVRYFNRRSSLSMPLAPAFCLTPHQQGGNRGMLFMASHPQAVVSLIQEAMQSRDTLANSPDYKKAMSGMDSNYALFYYNNCQGSYRRVYNFLLPLAAVWASSSRYPVDTGLLPVAAAIAPAMFGYALGMKQAPDGLALHAYSPLGFNGLFVILADKLVVSNPLVIGYLYAMMDSWMTTTQSPVW